MKKLRKYFFTGLLLVIPAFLTVYFLILIFGFIDGIAGGFLKDYMRSKIGFSIPGAGILLFVLTLILVGFLANRFVGRKIYQFLEKWFSSLPLINRVYPAFKQIVSFLLQEKEFGFKKVVLIEYPSKGLWSLGFLTNEQFEKLDRMFAKDMVTVFIPNTPGPFTGYFVFVAKEEMKFIDISVADALRMIISGGIFKPQG